MPLQTQRLPRRPHAPYVTSCCSTTFELRHLAAMLPPRRAAGLPGNPLTSHNKHSLEGPAVGILEEHQQTDGRDQTRLRAAPP